MESKRLELERVKREILRRERLQQIESKGLLDVIRERPAMYLGELSLSALCHFLNGYEMSLWVHGVQEKPPLPRDFPNWVADRLHFSENRSGYKNMILERMPNEAMALSFFFELLDEYRARPSAE
jgi:hypothetical protein